MRFSFSELAEAAEREVNIRRRVYPNRVMTRRMSRYVAEREIAIMQTIAAYFREREKIERLL